MAAEPISTSSAVAVSTAGAMGVTAAMIEVHFDPHLLMLSFVGAVIGAGLATPGRTKLHDVAMFLAVCLGAAQLGRSFGPVLAQYVQAVRDPGSVVAFVVAALFHPGFSVVAHSVKHGLPKLLERFGLSGAKP